MDAEPSVLVVDDEAGTREAIVRALQPLGCPVAQAGSAEEGLARLAKESFDVVLCDIRMGGMDGLEFQKRARVEYPELPVIIVTAYAAVETAVRALKQGAYDYLPKPFSGEEVRSAVRRAAESRRLRLENAGLREVARSRQDLWVGASGAMKRLYEQAAQAAQSRASIFISGESGSGKEILARLVHDASPRRDALFVPLNCAAVPDSLADSHLFGHVKGSFTGATADQRGLLEVSSGGTLFLDEIAELKPDVQARLLRVLEDRKVRRVGSEREVPVDPRLLAAAQSDPAELVKSGRLREDLYFRLATVHLSVPPLRERQDEIEGLALHFLGGFAKELKKPIEGLDPEALDALKAYGWPGNVRELRNVMERAAIFAPAGGRVGVGQLPPQFRKATGGPAFSVTMFPPPTLAELDDLYLRHVLDACEGNQTKAAKILGVSPSTLWRHRARSEPAPEPRQ